MTADFDINSFALLGSKLGQIANNIEIILPITWKSGMVTTNNRNSKMGSAYVEVPHKSDYCVVWFHIKFSFENVLLLRKTNLVLNKNYFWKNNQNSKKAEILFNFTL